MEVHDEKDYAGTGLTIRTAKLDQFKRFPEKNARPSYLLWGGMRIQTADSIAVGGFGRVRGEFISVTGNVEQGFDLDVKGWVLLPDGQRIRRLRTWYHAQLPLVVEYPFHSKDGLLWVWNVYKMRYHGGAEVEERWTENAGFWVETINARERIYHCSHGMATPPDFESLVFKISVTSESKQNQKPIARRSREKTRNL